MSMESLNKLRTKNNESLETSLNEEFITAESFDQQFNEEHILEIDGNDPVPYTTVSPENPISEDWVVYVGGFGQGKESYLDEIQSLAHSGRKVLFTNPTRGIEGNNELSAFEDVPDTIHNKARAVQEILNEVGATSVDFVGHSQGGAVISTFVAEHPGVAKKMVLLNSAGTKGGDDSWYKIIGRFGADKFEGLKNDKETLRGDSGKRAGNSFMKESIFNTKFDHAFRLNKEIPGVAAMDIIPLLKLIKQSGETEITFVNANNDKVYNTKAIAEMFGIEDILLKIEEEERAFENAVASGEKTEEDQVYSEKLSEELKEYQNEFVDNWANYSRGEATHSEPVAGKAGLLVSILNPEQHTKEINERLAREKKEQEAENNPDT